MMTAAPPRPLTILTMASVVAAQIVCVVPSAAQAAPQRRGFAPKAVVRAKAKVRRSASCMHCTSAARGPLLTCAACVLACRGLWWPPSHM